MLAGQVRVRTRTSASSQPRVTTHRTALPEHEPPQPAKRERRPGRASSVTCVPRSSLAEQLVPHEIPPTSLATEPAPFPRFWTSSVSSFVNLAPTATSFESVTVHVGRAPQPPPVQPANTEPSAG